MTEKEAAEVRKLTVEAEKMEAERDSARLLLEQQRREEADRVTNADLAHVYHFVGGVAKESAQTAIKALEWWSRRSPGCDMTIIFNSPGGSVLDGLALYDCILALRAKGHHITTVARGVAASMGGVLMQAGDDRVIAPNAHVLIHEPSSGAIGKLSDMEDSVEFVKMLSDRLAAILAERSTLSKQQVKRRWNRKEWWLDAEETVKLGFADRIG